MSFIVTGFPLNPLTSLGSRTTTMMMTNLVVWTFLLALLPLSIGGLCDLTRTGQRSRA